MGAVVYYPCKAGADTITPQKNGYEQAEVSLAPIATDMTLEEFLQNDLEGYEYVEGELVPMLPPSMEHGEISTNVIRYLDSHVYQHQLGLGAVP